MIIQQIIIYKTMWTALKTTVGNTIKTNNNNEITAEQDQLLRKSIIDQIGTYEFGGVLTSPITLASPSYATDTPSALDRKKYWFNTAGTWTNFGGLTTLVDEVGFLYNPAGTWTKVVLFSNDSSASTKVAGACSLNVVGAVGASYNYTNTSLLTIPLNTTESSPLNVDYVQTNTDAVNMPRVLIAGYVTIVGSVTINALEFPTSATLSIIGSNGNSLNKLVDLNNPMTIDFSYIVKADIQETFHMVLELSDSQDFSVITANLGILA
tara:strand:- start:1249 stop:2046 length:798 start_codon:yes stop_codon:yes gene_type:complete